MNNIDLNYYKEILLKEKEKVTNLVDKIDDNTVYGDNSTRSSMRENTGELSGYDNHPADMGTEVFMAEINMNLKDNEKDRLYQINAALDRINNGTYGICEKCKKEIEEERLDIIPESSLCSSCSNEYDKIYKNQDYRPIEEELLNKNDYFYSDILEDLADLNRNEEHDQVEDGF
ncbi:TraR/DksA C4-type zinc finger protein [Tepidibacter formicigenes]|jgi:YteA family regulatory protein|uniref:Transcriptional regulator, TraR/DksA family n=1 Tax=Tepidibacter formicigenes DSM 15518 TaxID=1123349 RepID=A0A1M6KFB2_9FIRM|nr:TraR/DksA C4-type zinc finger protein [Tepidibacter formicigenes]SHJ57646.1 transcriptional regulator, TraR/DksA family [Tepidibacter formicigenes DSM 15518]